MFDYMTNAPGGRLSIWLSGVCGWCCFTSSRSDGESGRVDDIGRGSVVIVGECIEVDGSV